MPRKKPTPSTIEDVRASLPKGLVTVGDLKEVPNQGVFSTGIEELDNLPQNPDGTSMGGLKRGGHWVIAGSPKKGKSFLCTHIAAHLQKQEFRIGWVDAERRIAIGGLETMRHLGVTTEEIVWIGQSDKGVSYILEDTLGAMVRVAQAGLVDFIFVDSLIALTPRDIAKSLDTGSDMPFESGAQAVEARALSRSLKPAAGVLSDCGVTCFLINQIREKPGVMFGDPKYTPGGRALEHIAYGTFWIEGPNKQEHGWHRFKITLKSSAICPNQGDSVEVILPTSGPLGSVSYEETEDEPEE